MPTATFQLEIGLALVEIEDAYRIVRMRQIEIAGRGRRDRRGIDLVIGNGFQAVDLESEGRCRHMALTKGHGRHRADQDADLGALVEALERGERLPGGTASATPVDNRALRSSDWFRPAPRGSAMMSSTMSQPGAADLVLGDDPVELQRDAELARQGLAQLDLEAGRIAGLAGEWQRVRVGAQAERAGIADRVERSAPAPGRADAEQRAEAEREEVFMASPRPGRCMRAGSAFIAA